jgi:hypothetical protein
MRKKRNTKIEKGRKTKKDFAEDTYLINTGGIRPLGKPIIDPMQCITKLYNSVIMILLDIPHFRRAKNVRLCVKQLVTHIHGCILWMDRLVHIYVALISKITRLPTFDVQPKE